MLMYFIRSILQNKHKIEYTQLKYPYSSLSHYKCKNLGGGEAVNCDGNLIVLPLRLRYSSNKSPCYAKYFL